MIKIDRILGTAEVLSLELKHKEEREAYIKGFNKAVELIKCSLTLTFYDSRDFDKCVATMGQSREHLSAVSANGKLNTFFGFITDSGQYDRDSLKDTK